MSVMTRIDARSQNNNSIQVHDSDGNILAVIEAVKSVEESNIPKLRNEANLRVTTADGIKIVKGNGAILRKK